MKPQSQYQCQNCSSLLFTNQRRAEMRGGAGIYFGHSGVTYWLPVSSEVTWGYCPHNHGAFLCLNTSFQSSGWGTFDRFSMHLVSLSRTFVQTTRCRISYIPSLLISPFCLLFAKNKKAMYNVWGWGRPLLKLKSIYHFFQSLRSMGF